MKKTFFWELHSRSSTGSHPLCLSHSLLLIQPCSLTEWQMAWHAKPGAGSWALLAISQSMCQAQFPQIVLVLNCSRAELSSLLPNFLLRLWSTPTPLCQLVPDWPRERLTGGSLVWLRQDAVVVAVVAFSSGQLVADVDGPIDCFDCCPRRQTSVASNMSDRAAGAFATGQSRPFVTQGLSFFLCSATPRCVLCK